VSEREPAVRSGVMVGSASIKLITRSARKSSDVGIVRPSAFAVHPVVCAARCPRVWSLRPYRSKTSPPRPPLDAHSGRSLCETPAQVGDHASRSMRPRISRNRVGVKCLSASCKMKYRAWRMSRPAGKKALEPLCARRLQKSGNGRRSREGNSGRRSRPASGKP